MRLVRNENTDEVNKRVNELEHELFKLKEETSKLYEKDYITNYSTPIAPLRVSEKSKIKCSSNKVSTSTKSGGSKQRLGSGYSSTSLNTRKAKPYSYEDENGSQVIENKNSSDDKNFGNREQYKANISLFSRKYDFEYDPESKYYQVNFKSLGGDLVRDYESKKELEESSFHKQLEEIVVDVPFLGTRNTKGKLAAPIMSYISNTINDFEDEVVYKDSYSPNTIKMLKKSSLLSHNSAFPSSTNSSTFQDSSNKDETNTKEYLTKDVHEEEEKEEKESGAGRLKISNNFLSNIPSIMSEKSGSDIKPLYENEREMLLRRIQSLEVIESSQHMLVLEAQNREQQYKIRNDELQKQLEYKETKLSLQNQEFEMLQRDMNVLKQEKRSLEEKFKQLEMHWANEYSDLHRYKVEYEVVQQQNKVLIEEKASFISGIESDRERYRQMENTNTRLLLQVRNLEERNMELTNKNITLQETTDALTKDYNKIFQQYTSLLTDHNCLRKNEDILNESIAEMQIKEKDMEKELKRMKEKLQGFDITERLVENLQSEMKELKEERHHILGEKDTLSSENKNLTKQIKRLEEIQYEMKNQILDYTLENQKLKKLIKNTFIPLLPSTEHASTINHVLTILSAKENSRMNTKNLEDLYLSSNGKSKKEDKFEDKNILNSRNSPRNDDKNIKLQCGENLKNRESVVDSNQELTDRSKSKLNEINSSITDDKLITEKLSVKKIQDREKDIISEISVDHLTNKIEETDTFQSTNEKEICLLNEISDSKMHVPKQENSILSTQVNNSLNKTYSLDLSNNQIIDEIVIREQKPDLLNHVVPHNIPTNIIGQIGNVLSKGNIPVVPIKTKQTFSDKDIYKIADSKLFEVSDNNLVDHGMLLENYEKQLFLLTVEKNQIEVELSTIPNNPWGQKKKEYEYNEYLQTRLLEIKGSLSSIHEKIKNLRME
ncbi:hypothetical protein ACR3K2_09550 [Cryptosporidium serpentis]